MQDLLTTTTLSREDALSVLDTAREMAHCGLNAGTAGKSGRRKICIVDWDGDGKLDILLNSSSANFLHQVDARDGKWFFKDEGPLVKQNIEGHDVSPAVVDWNGDGIPDFVGGAEDGHLYHLKNPRTAQK